jgi:hypothetical protein
VFACVWLSGRASANVRVWHKEAFQSRCPNTRKSYRPNIQKIGSVATGAGQVMYRYCRVK